MRTDPSPATSNTVSTVVASVTVTSAPTKKDSDHAGVIAGSVIAVVVVLAAGGVGAWIVLRKRKRARDAGLRQGKAGMKYSEMPDSELESMDGRREATDARGEVTDARAPDTVELDSRPRHEMLDDHTSAIRHELGN